MLLFADIERVDAGPAWHLEDSYSYYNRSARVGAARIRNLLQSWFDRYPESHQAELAARFRCDFDSAFYELFLHELVARLRIGVEPHPVLPSGIPTRPDFRLDEIGMASSYLEARVARDESGADRRKRRVLATIYDQINKLDVPDYFLRIVVLTLTAGRQPSTRRLGRELMAWLNTLDYDLLTRTAHQIESLDQLPTWEYKDSAIRVTISANPVSPAHRGASGHRPIGIYPIESRWGGSDVSLRKALERKAVKFGTLTAPYIIAVNSLSSWSFDRIDQMQALFGTEQLFFGARDEEPVMARMANGFWSGPRGPRHTRVSAVLFTQVGPWNVHFANMCLYHNPWASLPYKGRLTALHRAVPQEAKMEWITGLDPGTLFDLVPDWLGE